jgi:ferredoxin--NADP+ reductase
MSNLSAERVVRVNHWNESLFSFTTTRNAGFRFRNGHFVMVGLPTPEGRPLMRAFSLASANYEEELEFYSIKIQDGALTSRLQHIVPGDEVLIGTKPTGTLVLENLTDGKRLYLLATGTGLAPFMSIIRDPETYARFSKVVLVHGVRRVSDLGYHDYLEKELQEHPLVGDEVKSQFLYYPTVTREPFPNQGRITNLIDSGKMASDLGLPNLNAEEDRVMICGGPSVLKELVTRMEERGLQEGSTTGAAGQYVIERAFVEK